MLVLVICKVIAIKPDLRLEKEIFDTHAENI